MSKEEMVREIKWATRSSCTRACSPSDMIDGECKCGRDIIHIIDTYASEIAVGFAEWVGDLYYKSTDGYWFEKGHKGNLDPDPTPYTTPQLFQQFLTNKNEKKC